MVIGQRMSRHWGAGGRGMPSPSTPIAKGYAPQGDEQTTKKEKVGVGYVMGMMRCFQKMSEALINHLDRDEGRGCVPNEGSQQPPIVSDSTHRLL
jgi:hypothetical protein